MIRFTPSSLPRIAKCPGAYWAEQGLPYETSEAAEEGHLLHAVMAGADDASLSSAQKEDIATCRREGNELWNSLGMTGANRLKEKRLTVRLQGEVEVNGKMDFFAYVPTVKALIIDWKFGRGDEEGADESAQTKAYAVMAFEEYKVQTVHVAIVQPRADHDRRVSVCVYDAADLEAARREIVYLAQQVNLSRDTRTPGPMQCRFCKAAGTNRCPESQQQLIAISQAMGELHGEELAIMLDLCPMAERMVKHYRDLARKDLEAGIEVPGWKLSEPVPVRRIKDVSKAWDAINESGLLLATQFISACKINIGEIEELIREAGGLTAKAAKEKVNELLEDVIELDTRRPSLEKVK